MEHNEFELRNKLFNASDVSSVFKKDNSIKPWTYPAICENVYV